MQSKSPKMAPSVRKWCPRAPKIEPKTTPGPLFSGFGDPLFSCNTTVVLLYFMGSRVPGTAQNEKKTRSLNSALQKVRKKRKKCAFSGQRCRKRPQNGCLTLCSTLPVSAPVAALGAQWSPGGVRKVKNVARASKFSENHKNPPRSPPANGAKKAIICP